MSECLGLYIENNLIKYAKVAKEHNDIKIEAFGIKSYDQLEDALKQIIQETYSFKTPISVNLSDEMYNYFDLFSMLNKKDSEQSIKTEFDFLCEEREFNKKVLETRYFTVNNMESNDKIRVIHISVNKTEIAKKSQQLNQYKLRNISPLPISITNLVELNGKENIAIINLEEKTSITIIVNGQIYKVDVIDKGMRDILENINLRENSYSKAYEICKNSTIYTKEGEMLQVEGNDYLEDIMLTLYEIVTKTKRIILDDNINISKLYITGSGAIINNIDLYFQEKLPEVRCEILKPYFVQTQNVRLNIKDYIEVNSATAIAMQGLGEGLKNVNFKEVGFLEKIEVPSKSSTSKKSGIFSKLSSISISFNMGGELDKIDRKILHFAEAILILIILYSIASYFIGQQIKIKAEDTQQVINKINEQISMIDNDVNTIKSRESEYKNYINKLNAIRDETIERYRIKNAIPNLLNRIMSIIPKNVQLTSIQNTEGRHVTIKAQSENYEQLGIFKAKIDLDGVLTDVKSDTGTKDGDIVKMTIEGDLP